jgi:hypothetical protein
MRKNPKEQGEGRESEEKTWARWSPQCFGVLTKVSEPPKGSSE